MEGIFGEGLLATSAIVCVSVLGASIGYYYFFKNKDSPQTVTRNVETKRVDEIKKQPQKQSSPKPRPKKDGGLYVKILFGSQTGTAEEFSKTLAEEAANYKFEADVVDLETYTMDDLVNEKFVIFVTATYGDGEPTDNAKDFYQALMSEDHPPDLLSNLQFSVFGLGNKTYQHYNSVGRAIDKRVEELGGKRLYERGEGDDDGSLEQDFNVWKTKFWEAICSKFQLTEIESSNETPVRRAKLEFIDSDIPISSPTLERANDVNTGYDPKKPFTARILVNKELHTALSDRSCRHVELDIGDKIYEPGDHLGIYPQNSKEAIAEFVKVLNIEDILGKTFVLKPVDSGSKNTQPLMGPCTIEYALTHLVELTAVPRQSILKPLLQYVNDPAEKEEFSLLVSEVDAMNKYNHWVKQDQRTLPEIFSHFKSLKPPVDHILEILPRMQPRFYSISSSLKAHPNRVHITSVVVSYTTATGRVHNGVCSSWLSTVVPTEDHQPAVKVFLRKSTFHLPKDPLAPVIMIGPGTGVAPFRGFIQERKFYEKINPLANVLFFGSRHREHDFIYRDEFSEYEQNKIITLLLAFSREQRTKTYVQHKIEEHKDIILQNLDTVYIYVCGDAKNMAKDVHSALVKLLMDHLKVTHEDCENYLKNLSNSGRYQQDVW
eukprot:TRINITY_DN6199_c0_g1_i1.p1 TRINITY_DN6199_c0_g1~~TRINITY_DN6199_c0_g1_i1.p1  ORF type:complete len:674 (-),score=127.37 TRINITY_DN6199_c0_g1_i1:38-2017(-)